MLHITRKIGDKIVINNDITLEITSISKNKVRISCEFPSGVSIMRKELHDKISAQNTQANSFEVSNKLPEIDLLKISIDKKQ